MCLEYFMYRIYEFYILTDGTMYGFETNWDMTPRLKEDIKIETFFYNVHFEVPGGVSSWCNG